MQVTLYLAYGMNTNINQMSYRCPDAISIGCVEISGYSMVFRGVADIEEDSNGILQAALWDITSNCERALDMLEGYPEFYHKKYIDVVIGSNTHRAMIYQMTNDYRVDYHPPRKYYQNMLEDGYADHGIDLQQIYNAPGFNEVEDNYVYQWPLTLIPTLNILRVILKENKDD